ncbi:MAG: hypothetical protein AB7O68_25960 [Pirellulales bacterium]
MTVYAPMLRERRILGCKTETTVGTPIALAAADATINVWNVDIQNEGEYEPRDGQGNFSPLSGTVGPEIGTVKFQTEVYGGASAPLWMSKLLPACGAYGAALAYTPQTNPPGSGNVKTLTIGVWEDGLFKSIAGAMGNPVFTFTAGKRVMVEFTFRGVWQPPVDAALPTPTYITTAPLKFDAAALTYGTWTPRAANMTLDFGNDVQIREDGSSTGGILSACIVNRAMKVTMDPESMLIASGTGEGDVFGMRLAGTNAALAWTLDNGVTSLAFAAPKAQITKITTADRNKLQTDQIELALNRSASLGDDELTITSGT